MKTIRATFKKGPHVMTCTLLYHYSDNPQTAKLDGKTEEFLLANHKPIQLFGPINRLESIAEFQAGQIGATFEIEDLGGDALEWMDDVVLE